MKTAIVILNFNGENLLKQFLPSVIANSNSPGTEIIVADNHSSDNSIQFLSENFPQIRTILLNDNYGFAGGYNKALKQVDAEYYVLLNSDVQVTENWLSVIPCMDKHLDIAACQPKIKSFTNPDFFEYAGACGGFLDKYGYPFCRGRIFDTIEKDLHQYDSITDIFWATGACLVIRSKDFHECGGFDEDFFAHMEEIDLCWRLQLQKKRIACFPSSIVLHVGAKTLKKENPFKTYLNFRNNLLMLYKNLPKNQLRKILFIRKLLDYTAFSKMILTGQFDSARSIYKARKDFKKMKSTFFMKRQMIQINAQNKSIPLFPHSILWKFYGEGKRHFSEIIN